MSRTEQFKHFSVTTTDGVVLRGDVGGMLGAPAVILMHGGGQTRFSWSGAMKALVDAGYYVINYDARGHGDSDWSKTGDYSLPFRALDLKTVIAELVPSGVPVAYVGASLGGATSMWALTEGERPAAVILVDIVPNPDPVGVQKIRDFMQANPNGFANYDEAADAIAAYNPNRPRYSDHRGLDKNLRLRDDGRYYWHWDPLILGRKLDDDVGEFKTTVDGLKKVQDVPILLVRGLNSDVVNEQGITELKSAMPNLELYDVEGAGHMVAGDRNDAFNQGVLSFLTRVLPVKPQ